MGLGCSQLIYRRVAHDKKYDLRFLHLFYYIVFS
jgi:hypothetical protein